MGQHQIHIGSVCCVCWDSPSPCSFKLFVIIFIRFFASGSIQYAAIGLHSQKAVAACLKSY